MSKNVKQQPRHKHFVRTSARNNEKHTSVSKIIQETRVYDYLACYANDLNHILTRAGTDIVVGLEFEKPNKRDDINLNNIDPIAADFVRSLKHKIAFANRKMLKSFRLKLSIQEVTA